MEGEAPRAAVHDDKITLVLFSQELSTNRVVDPLLLGGSQVVRVILGEVIPVSHPPGHCAQQGWLTRSPAARSAAHASSSRAPPRRGAAASANSSPARQQRSPAGSPTGPALFPPWLPPCQESQAVKQKIGCTVYLQIGIMSEWMCLFQPS